MFNVTIYYIEKSPEYLCNVQTLDVLVNGFFRIVDDEQTYLLNPDTIERIEAENPEEET